MNDVITVTVRGPTASGKTALIQVIKHLLESNEIETHVEMDDILPTAKIEYPMDRAVRDLKKNDPLVSLIEENVSRGAKG